MTSWPRNASAVRADLVLAGLFLVSQVAVVGGLRRYLGDVLQNPGVTGSDLLSPSSTDEVDVVVGLAVLIDVRQAAGAGR